MKRFENLNAILAPLSDGIHPPNEKLPEPIRIDVSKEQYDKFFCISDNIETETKIAASFQDSTNDAPLHDSSQSAQ